MTIRKVLIGACALLLVTGCATQGGSETVKSEGETTEAYVAHRAVERWNALIRGDVETAYSYLSPGFRSAKPLSIYERMVGGGATRWEAVDIQDTACEQDTCALNVKVTYQYVGSIREMVGQTFNTVLQENWVRVDSEWWFVPR